MRPSAVRAGPQSAIQGKDNGVARPGTYQVAGGFAGGGRRHATEHLVQFLTAGKTARCRRILRGYPQRLLEGSNGSGLLPALQGLPTRLQRGRQGGGRALSQLPEASGRLIQAGRRCQEIPVTQLLVAQLSEAPCFQPVGPSPLLGMGGPGRILGAHAFSQRGIGQCAKILDRGRGGCRRRLSDRRRRRYGHQWPPFADDPGQPEHDGKDTCEQDQKADDDQQGQASGPRGNRCGTDERRGVRNATEFRGAGLHGHVGGIRRDFCQQCAHGAQTPRPPLRGLLQHGADELGQRRRHRLPLTVRAEWLGHFRTDAPGRDLRVQRWLTRQQIVEQRPKAVDVVGRRRGRAPKLLWTDGGQ